MRRVLLTFFFVVIFICLNAQNSLPNQGFEEWTNYEYYEEPSGGVWTTANKAILLNPEVFKATTFKTTDAYAGTYAVRMVTDAANTTPPLLLTGTLATGVFDELALPPNNLYTGTPFTARPESFKLYYKYFSIEHDSCDIWAISHRWNSETEQRDTIGVAWITDSTRVSEYTLLSIPFDYWSEELPDSISVVFASSAAGDLFAGQIGSTLYVDQISFEMSNGIDISFLPEIQVLISPNPVSERITFELSEPLNTGELSVYDINGKLISKQKMNGLKATYNVADLQRGIYYYQIFDHATFVNGGSFIVHK